jgi:hypothetical protein
MRRGAAVGALAGLAGMLVGSMAGLVLLRPSGTLDQMATGADSLVDALLLLTLLGLAVGAFLGVRSARRAGVAEAARAALAGGGGAFAAYALLTIPSLLDGEIARSAASLVLGCFAAALGAGIGTVAGGTGSRRDERVA